MKIKIRITSIIAVIILTALSGISSAQEVIHQYVISSGGGTSTSASYQVTQVTGQALIAPTVSNDNIIYSGFLSQIHQTSNNQSPMITAYAPDSDQSAASGDSLEFAVEMQDSDSSPLYVTWYLDETVLRADTTTGNNSLIWITFTSETSVEKEVRAVISDGFLAQEYSWTVSIIVTAVEDDPEPIVPDDFVLKQNYPNPFNPSTTIRFDLPTYSHVNLVIYNVSGEVVRTLANENFGFGNHRIVWDGRDDLGRQVSSGIYFYRLTAGRFTAVKKMLLIK
ncbi:MAG: T9SS type A sorting domain-containing protein [bacterium]|nr:T9SS type A sorting domain-containing protein [bacterium]